ncbi:hypothetical protein ABZ543_08420 [Streptomyces roseifaciens]
MDETFGPQYLRPSQKACPNCWCCSEALCERGRNSVARCVGFTPPEHRVTVHNCPCSAETTKHTLAWRSAQVRVTRWATEHPLLPEAENLLRTLAAGYEALDPGNLFPQLKFRGLADVLDRPVITALGRTYLAARDDTRAATAVLVVAIGTKTRTARVDVPAWKPDTPVIVPVDQITNDTRLNAGALLGRWLQADANLSASDADNLVLTSFRIGPPPVRPAGESR